MANNKKSKQKMGPLGNPLGNPLKFFREGGEQRKAMFKNGGYKVPQQNSLPKKNMGGSDDLMPPLGGGNSGMTMKPYISKPLSNVPMSMSNPMAQPNALMNALSYKPSRTFPKVPTMAPVSSTVITEPSAITSSSASSAPVLSAKERIANAKADAKIANINARKSKKEARANALVKEYAEGKRKVKTVADWVDSGINAAGVVIDGINTIKSKNKRGGSIEPKASKGMIVKSKKK